ncbi:MAG: bifunctional hydroxymethylpyrimidine kinase/phosphomethylpyrimidine kinase [Oscillospiraceae bacterium]|nr:bifunctional hydroxymethylpyrimidine kinase/phosphomethylpyrimidine kinase [Oscillospiraceae bacterium]
MSVKKCLTIAGSDCSGGAGIQADLKTFAAHGCYGASVITSIVSENTEGVLSTYNVPVNEVANQLDAVFEDIQIDAVKLGVLPTVDIIKIVAEKLMKYLPKYIVCDPVLMASSGDALTSEETIDAYIEHIFPLVTLITPNIPEAGAFTGMSISTINDMKGAAAAMYSLGASAVMVKGGHLEEGHATDVLYDGKDASSIRVVKVDSPNTHGTGCTLSSAIAANLANGFALGGAVFSAKDYVTEAISKSYPVGKGHGPVNHFFEYWKDMRKHYEKAEK